MQEEFVSYFLQLFQHQSFPAQLQPCYYLSRRNAVALGIIRDMDHRNIQKVGDTDGEDLETVCLKVS